MKCNKCNKSPKWYSYLGIILEGNGIPVHRCSHCNHLYTVDTWQWIIFAIFTIFSIIGTIFIKNQLFNYLALLIIVVCYVAVLTNFPTKNFGDKDD